MKKYIKYIFSFWIFFFILVVSMGATRHVFMNGTSINGAPKAVVIFLSSLLTNIQHYDEVQNPMFVNSDSKLKNGFTYSKNYTSSKDYLLISSWDISEDQTSIKLIRISDGKILYKWVPDPELINENFNQSKNYLKQNNLDKYTTRLLHPLLLNDGSIIFGGGGITKIDRFSKIVWDNVTNCHHSIELDSSNIWICSYNQNRKNADKFQIMDDEIQQLSINTGKILFKKSVYEILMENGFNRAQFFINPLITADQSYLDYMHLNDVQPVAFDSKFWLKGDLFISLRHQNLVFLYRPSNNKIIWSKTGPWLKQHDITILDDHRIAIFGNNALDAAYSDKRKSLIDGSNIQYIYDFSKDEVSKPYNKFFSSSKIGTYTEGRAKILNDETIFVEESNHGRILLGNKNNVIWSYLERMDNKNVSTLNWSRYITEEEFKKFTFMSSKK
jgi:hypothetical protein